MKCEAMFGLKFISHPAATIFGASRPKSEVILDFIAPQNAADAERLRQLAEAEAKAAGLAEEAAVQAARQAELEERLSQLNAHKYSLVLQLKQVGLHYLL